MRVMIAEDAVLFREGLSRVLTDAGFDVRAKVGDAQALLAGVRDDPPDAVVVDIRMPPTHTTEGLDAAKAIKASTPRSGFWCFPRTSRRISRCELLDAGSPASATCSRSG